MPSSLGGPMYPRRADEATTAGDARYPRPPTPMRLAQLRLNDEIAVSPFVSASGPCPKHGPHHDSRMTAPTERNTSPMLSPPRRGSPRSISRFTPPDPGNTMNSFAARVAPFFRAAAMTSAASSRSEYPPFVHDPMNALSNAMRSRAISD